MLTKSLSSAVISHQFVFRTSGVYCRPLRLPTTRQIVLPAAHISTAWLITIFSAASFPERIAYRTYILPTASLADRVSHPSVRRPSQLATARLIEFLSSAAIPDRIAFRTYRPSAESLTGRIDFRPNRLPTASHPDRVSDGDVAPTVYTVDHMALFNFSIPFRLPTVSEHIAYPTYHLTAASYTDRLAYRMLRLPTAVHAVDVSNINGVACRTSRLPNLSIPHRFTYRTHPLRFIGTFVPPRGHKQHVPSEG